MATDDAEAERLQSLAEESLAEVLQLNNDIFVGNGVPDVNHSPPMVVRRALSLGRRPSAVQLETSVS